MGEESGLSLNDLPNDPFDRRAKILEYAASAFPPRTIAYMREEYEHSSLLLDCIAFGSSDLMDAPRADVRNLQKVWFFPWGEACRELEQVQNACMLTMYKAAHDHLRRALEMVIIGTYFVLDDTPDEKAHAWMSSETGSPYFRNTLRELLKYPRFALVNDECDWSDRIQSLYWKLSDATHVRGTDYGFSSLQPSHGRIGDVWMPTFNAEALSRVLGQWIDVVRHQATALALTNPVLLLELDLEEKFGMNEPVSGFYTSDQSARIRRLLIDGAAKVFEEIVHTDAEVTSVRKWFDALPNITEADLAIQAGEFNLLFDRDN